MTSWAIPHLLRNASWASASYGATMQSTPLSRHAFTAHENHTDQQLWQQVNSASFICTNLIELCVYGDINLPVATYSTSSLHKTRDPGFQPTSEMHPDIQNILGSKTMPSYVLWKSADHCVRNCRKMPYLTMLGKMEKWSWIHSRNRINAKMF